MKGTKAQKGITLIALIITIVVLLILAAVAISNIKNDGILGYATNAAADYNQAVKNEQEQLKNYLDFLNQETCSEHKYENGVCINCGYGCSSHTWVVTTTVANCATQTDATKISKCSICGFEKTETIAEWSHTFENGSVSCTNPDCDAECPHDGGTDSRVEGGNLGYHTINQYCKICGGRVTGIDEEHTAEQRISCAICGWSCKHQGNVSLGHCFDCGWTCEHENASFAGYHSGYLVHTGSGQCPDCDVYYSDLIGGEAGCFDNNNDKKCDICSTDMETGHNFDYSGYCRDCDYVCNHPNDPFECTNTGWGEHEWSGQCPICKAYAVDFESTNCSVYDDGYGFCEACGKQWTAI